MPKPVLASMSNWLDVALTTGPARARVLSDFKRRQIDQPRDFYQPLRETIVDIHKGRGADAAFAALLGRTVNVTAAKLYPKFIEGHRTFIRAHLHAAWFEPAHGALPAGPGIQIAANPELGLVLGGINHHLKLYLRTEELSQRRVDLAIALIAMSVSIPDEHRIAVLDVRKGALRYLDPKSAAPRGWRLLSAFVAMEAAAYAAGWARL